LSKSLATVRTAKRFLASVNAQVHLQVARRRELLGTVLAHIRLLLVDATHVLRVALAGAALPALCTIRREWQHRLDSGEWWRRRVGSVRRVLRRGLLQMRRAERRVAFLRDRDLLKSIHIAIRTHAVDRMIPFAKRSNLRKLLVRLVRLIRYLRPQSVYQVIIGFDLHFKRVGGADVRVFFGQRMIFFCDRGILGRKVFRVQWRNVAQCHLVDSFIITSQDSRHFL
jgi:hypothetical protein